MKITKATQEQKIATLVELDGYTINGPSNDPAEPENWCWDGNGNNKWLNEFEYYSSYDAIIPLIQKLFNGKNFRKFDFALLKVRGLPEDKALLPSPCLTLKQTPAKLSDAVLIATGKFTA